MDDRDRGMPTSVPAAEPSNSPWGAPTEHGGRLMALLRAGGIAAEATLPFFGSHQLLVESKEDQSPVTIADRTAEAQFRHWISTHFPGDAILGEEHGEREGSSAYRWVVDPIDGTKSFIAGVPLYSTLVALEHGGEPIAGGIWIPALGEIVVAATGLGCWHQRHGARGWEPARVAPPRPLSEAILVTTAIDSFAAVGAASTFGQLQNEVRFTRTWGDGYGYLLVATGRADLMVDPIVNPWDVAPLLPVIREAGGIFTDWEGKATTRSTHAVASSGPLHAEVLRLLRPSGSIAGP